MAAPASGQPIRCQTHPPASRRRPEVAVEPPPARYARLPREAIPLVWWRGVGGAGGRSEHSARLRRSCTWTAWGWRATALRLFDHLVGAGEERLRHGETERFGGLHVDKQLELGRLLDGKLARFRPLQDLVYIHR